MALSVWLAATLPAIPDNPEGDNVDEGAEVGVDLQNLDEDESEERPLKESNDIGAAAGEEESPQLADPAG